MSNAPSPLALRLLLPPSSYGRQRYYPLCDLAHFICALRNRKTLTLDDLAVARLFGYRVIIEGENGRQIAVLEPNSPSESASAQDRGGAP
jgi:hypothetical protein